MSQLHTCPTCGKEVSAQALACPACGHPIKRRRLDIFGPSVKDYLAERPDVSLVRFYFAGFWRFMLLYFGIAVLIGFVGGFLGALASL